MNASIKYITYYMKKGGSPNLENVDEFNSSIESMSDLEINQIYELYFYDTEGTDGRIYEEIALKHDGIYRLRNINTVIFNELYTAVTYAVFENTDETVVPRNVFVAIPLIPEQLPHSNFFFKFISFIQHDSNDNLVLGNAIEPRLPYSNRLVSQNDYISTLIINIENYVGCVIFPHKENKENNDIINGEYEICPICYSPLNNMDGPGRTKNCRKKCNDVIQVCNLKHYLHRGCALELCNLEHVNVAAQMGFNQYENYWAPKKNGKCPYCVTKDMIPNLETVEKVDQENLNVQKGGRKKRRYRTSKRRTSKRRTSKRRT